MITRLKISHVLVVLIYFLLISSNLRAEEENPLAAIIENPDNAERCVDLQLIDRTHIVDNEFILFYMRNKDIFLNVLPRTCPGLKSANRFMYRVSMHRLCNVDIITVLELMGGGFLPGPSCGLGLFYPVDKKTAKQLRKRKN